MSKENSLFNNTTIKRLVSDIPINLKQKKAVKRWLQLLKEKREKIAMLLNKLKGKKQKSLISLGMG